MEVLDLLANVLNAWIILAILVVVFLRGAVKFVPQNTAFVIERFGKYNKTMEAGLNFLVPFIDRVAYVHTPKRYNI
ncbi:SPFH domain-containing protein [Enterovibrio coralii]|uniref:Band 7 domain-containing protein n=1 Tax=Enterovibrio coralii TaxID=294935 RepID=A0A135IAG0_9GAMM|nr:SPFH domain-containing protein [Enterovibrio coralii]KXF82445.1 hypothetical protein ATN88_10055 [Enterovibrio coralii]